MSTGKVTQHQQEELVVEYITLKPISADPPAPAEGECVIWVSDGTGTGSEGDLICKSTSAGTAKYNIVHDQSAGT